MHKHLRICPGCGHTITKNEFKHWRDIASHRANGYCAECLRDGCLEYKPKVKKVKKH